MQSRSDLHKIEKFKVVLCMLRFVHLVDISMSHHGRCDECSLPELLLSAMLTGVCGGVDLTSPPIKRNLNKIKGVRYGR